MGKPDIILNMPYVPFRYQPTPTSTHGALFCQHRRSEDMTREILRSFGFRHSIRTRYSTLGMPMYESDVFRAWKLISQIQLFAQSVILESARPSSPIHARTIVSRRASSAHRCLILPLSQVAVAMSATTTRSLAIDVKNAKAIFKSLGFVGRFEPIIRIDFAENRQSELIVGNLPKFAPVSTLPGLVGTVDYSTLFSRRYAVDAINQIGVVAANDPANTFVTDANVRHDFRPRRSRRSPVAQVRQQFENMSVPATPVAATPVVVPPPTYCDLTIEDFQNHVLLGLDNMYQPNHRGLFQDTSPENRAQQRMERYQTQHGSLNIGYFFQMVEGHYQSRIRPFNTSMINQIYRLVSRPSPGVSMENHRWDEYVIQQFYLPNGVLAHPNLVAPVMPWTMPANRFIEPEVTFTRGDIDRNERIGAWANYTSDQLRGFSGQSDCNCGDCRQSRYLFVHGSLNSRAQTIFERTGSFQLGPLPLLERRTKPNFFNNPFLGMNAIVTMMLMPEVSA